MLLSSGNNLEYQAIKFLNDSRNVTLFSAYIKLSQLKRINLLNNVKEIIVRWEVQDLCLGVSDIELYTYCQQNNITLYRNTRIHLKAIWDGQGSVFFGSANITGKGIGEQGKYNYELNDVNHNLSLEDKLYFKSIINSSEIVDKELYQKLKLLSDSYKSREIDYPKLETKVNFQDKFLLSQLPMSTSPVFLLDSFFHRQNLSDIDEECLIHDLSTFNIGTNQDRIKMEEELRISFNSHPFIKAVKDTIKNSNSSSMRYGSVVKWIQSNTTTVPTPRSWELKQDQIVNILYDWICYFDIEFYWNRPNHSQIIHFKN